MKEDARCCSCVYTGDRHTTTVPTAPRGREPSCLRTAGLGVGHFTLSLQRHFLLSWKSLFWQILNTEGKPGEAQGWGPSPPRQGLIWALAPPRVYPGGLLPPVWHPPWAPLHHVRMVPATPACLVRGKPRAGCRTCISL